MNRKTTIAAFAAVALIAAGCSYSSDDSGDKNATDPAPDGASAQPPAAVVKPGTLTTRDVKLTVKTTSKQCFGSAGCSVDWTIVPAVDESKLGEQDVLITYEVRGVEDGPQIDSFTLGSDGSYSSDEVKGFGQTKSKSAKLTAVATSIE